jgi:DNA-binding MarR family transcriptional regulator
MVVEAGEITPAELARRTDIDPAVVTRQSRLLEAAGLIIRTRDKSDGRLSGLIATDFGRTTEVRMRKMLNRHMRLALRTWAEEDVEILATLMARLARDLRAIPDPDLPRG